MKHEEPKQYNIGDIIKVKKDLIDDARYDDVYFNPSMRKYCGREFIIEEKVFKPRYAYTCLYKLKIVGSKDWCWSRDMLEDVNKK